MLGMVGETMEFSHRIHGVRLLDKMGVTKGKVTDNVRFEIWYHACAFLQEKKLLRKSMEQCLTTQLDGTLGPPLRPDAILEKKH